MRKWVLLVIVALMALPLRAQEVEAPPVEDPDAVESAASEVPLAEIRRFVGVFNAVRDAYVDPVSDEELMHAAIKGLLLDLDPHSVYFDKEDADAFEEETSGAYGGIGVEVQPQGDGTILVVAPIDDTPAARAGLKSGDLIVAIDGKPMQPGEDGQGTLRGKPGSEVTLTIAREGTDEPFDVRIVRETIRITSVRGRMLEPGYGYIRIAAFQADTAADFERVLEDLQKESGGLKGLVLDLRSNPGGLLVSAVQIADDLLRKGDIVSTRGRIALSDTLFGSTPGDRLNDAPLVLVVDAGTASAAEVLAGALRDNGRARIVGSRTFGKGSVQTLLPLDNGDSVKLTTARYYTPSGKSIQALGIMPDVVLHPEEEGAAHPAEVTEATLPGHLQAEAEAKAEAVDQPGEVLEGRGPIDAALAELKKMQRP
ncbi:MAG TPA: S41 family peptidase [Luteimonas sp.]|nr:S41 family peptidase [Luteimonas sp.]